MLAKLFLVAAIYIPTYYLVRTVREVKSYGRDQPK